MRVCEGKTDVLQDIFGTCEDADEAEDMNTVDLGFRVPECGANGLARVWGFCVVVLVF